MKHYKPVLKEIISIGKNQQQKLKQIVLKTLRKQNSKTPFSILYKEILDDINSGELKWFTDSDVIDYIENTLEY